MALSCYLREAWLTRLTRRSFIRAKKDNCEELSDQIIVTNVKEMLVFKPLQTFQALSVIVCLGQNKMKNYLFILSRKCILNTNKNKITFCLTTWQLRPKHIVSHLEMLCIILKNIKKAKKSKDSSDNTLMKKMSTFLLNLSKHFKSLLGCPWWYISSYFYSMCILWITHPSVYHPSIYLGRPVPVTIAVPRGFVQPVPPLKRHQLL